MKVPSFSTTLFPIIIITMAVPVVFIITFPIITGILAPILSSLPIVSAATLVVFSMNIISGSNSNALYNPNGIGHQNFELHGSEENNLVVKILLLAGISMKDMGLAQLAGQKEANTKQQEKQ